MFNTKEQKIHAQDQPGRSAHPAPVLLAPPEEQRLMELEETDTSIPVVRNVKTPLSGTDITSIKTQQR